MVPPFSGSPAHPVPSNGQIRHRTNRQGLRGTRDKALFHIRCAPLGLPAIAIRAASRCRKARMVRVQTGKMEAHHVPDLQLSRSLRPARPCFAGTSFGSSGCLGIKPVHGRTASNPARRARPYRGNSARQNRTDTTGYKAAVALIAAHLARFGGRECSGSGGSQTRQRNKRRGQPFCDPSACRSTASNPLD